MSEKVYSSCGEIFNDDCACYDNGDTYWSGDKREVSPSDLIGDWAVMSLFESMQEQLYDEVGEVADTFEMSKLAEKELLEAIKDAVDKHLTVRCFGVDNIEEHVMSDEE